jgi:hypothetical protein
MQRFGDLGPYHPDNVRKGTPHDNSKTAAKNVRHRNVLRNKQLREQELLSAPVSSKDWDDLPEDEQELTKMFGVRTVGRWNY